MAGYHRFDGHESEWYAGVGVGQGGLACCNSWGPKESDGTERLNWTKLIDTQNMGLLIDNKVRNHWIRWLMLKWANDAFFWSSSSFYLEHINLSISFFFFFSFPSSKAQFKSHLSTKPGLNLPGWEDTNEFMFLPLCSYIFGGTYSVLQQLQERCLSHYSN